MAAMLTNTTIDEMLEAMICVRSEAMAASLCNVVAATKGIMIT
jgi:hypothetical protein